MQVKEARTEAELEEFIEFPASIYPAESPYVPVLKHALKERFSQKKNPFFGHASVKFFLAYRDGRAVGRVASILNRKHNDCHRDETGFFGLFECTDDGDTARALLWMVENEMKGAGMTALRGPVNFSMNEECGLLLEGFDAHPMLMTPYNPPYYNFLLKDLGYKKARDLLAFIMEVPRELPDKLQHIAHVARLEGVSVRPLDIKNFHAGMMAFKDVYNSSREGTWGHVPITGAELEFAAGKLKDIAAPGLMQVAKVDDATVGFMGLVPDYNFVLKRMGGKTGPASVAKALYYSKRIPGLRMLLFGVKPEYKARGVDALMFTEAFEAVRKGGYKQVEFSWIFEDDLPVQMLAETAGGVQYKKYRIYEKEL